MAAYRVFLKKKVERFYRVVQCFTGFSEQGTPFQGSFGIWGFIVICRVGFVHLDFQDERRVDQCVSRVLYGVVSQGMLVSRVRTGSYRY